MLPVVIEGDGVAAACVARLLTDAGVDCVRETNARPKLAAILLSAQTQHLLRELFPATQDAPEDLFSGFARVSRRVVLWGDQGSAANLPHAGIVAPEDDLLRRLWQRVPNLPSWEGDDGMSWRVLSSGLSSTDGQERCFGSRVARVAEVELRKDVEAEACWIESVADGWLFLLTRGEGRGTLIAVGAAVLSLLSTSRLIAERVAGVRVAGSAIRVYPRLRRSLIAGNTIFCGSAAMSFDPLCGEGAGNAVREAFLAAAVVRAGMGGADCGSLKDHYVARLRQGFLRHLEICLQFYATATFGEGWGQELEALRAGITELQMQRAGDPPALFRLVDRDLVAL